MAEKRGRDAERRNDESKETLVQRKRLCKVALRRARARKMHPGDLLPARVAQATSIACIHAAGATVSARLVCAQRLAPLLPAKQLLVGAR